MNKKKIQSNTSSFFDIHIINTIDSTNNELKRQSEYLNEGYTLIANHQTNGRGRNAHSFHCKKDTSIYLSLFLKPKLPFSSSLRITTIAAIAIVKTIQKNYGIPAKIKWVNDIFIKDKKVAGILCESKLSSDSQKLDYMIVGIGINIHSYTMPDELKDIAGCVEDFSEYSISRNQFISDLLNHFLDLYNDILNPEIIQTYKNYSCILNKEIKVIEPKRNYTAKAVDIDENGFLIVEKDNKKFPLLSGEIHIRPKYLTE